MTSSNINPTISYKMVGYFFSSPKKGGNFTKSSEADTKKQVLSYHARVLSFRMWMLSIRMQVLSFCMKFTS